jgi:hypothetical protein
MPALLSAGGCLGISSVIVLLLETSLLDDGNFVGNVDGLTSCKGCESGFWCGSAIVLGLSGRGNGPADNSMVVVGNGNPPSELGRSSLTVEAVALCFCGTGPLG